MILQGDCLARLAEIPDESVHCVVTSPPYFGLRNYGFDGQIGLEETPEAYVAKLMEVFREVRRALRGDGVLWLNLGDSYTANGKASPHRGLSACSDRCAPRKNPRHSFCYESGEFQYPDRSTPPGLKPKDLIGIPWRVAFALQADGWYLRSDIIWHKNNPMPESVTDRCTKSHEHIFMLTKSARYFYDNEAVKEPSVSDHKSGNGFKGRQGGSSRGGPLSGGEGTAEQWDGVGGTRNRRDVWTIATKPYKGAHFATFPPEIPEICIKAGTSERGCCPVCGAPWVRVVRKKASESERLDRLDCPQSHHAGQTPHRRGNYHPSSDTIGFSPSCSCDAGKPVPCTVLDPFAGSGTTGAVAKSLGRDYILIEANPDYIELIEERIKAAERPPATLEDFAP